MPYWIVVLALGLPALLLLLLLRRLRRRHKQSPNVDFFRYKSDEIHKRGHYHDIVK